MDRDELNLGGDFDVETPEQVVFQLERAGVGTRAVAALLDVLVLAFVYLALFSVLWFVFAGAFSISDRGLAEDGFNVALALLILAAFSIFGLYYIGFEALWNGQTPGKRIVRIRVVSDTGVPASMSQFVVRNVLRLLDSQGGYAVGLIAMFVSPEEKRLGDMAAGTIVVRDGVAPGEAVRLGAVTPAARRLSDEHVELMRHFWQRASDLDPKQRFRLTRQVADAITTALGRPPLAAGSLEREFFELTRELFVVDAAKRP